MSFDKARMMEEIRLGIQKIRGRNLYRGREEYFLQQGLVILPAENRKNKITGAEVRIHFTDRPDGVKGEVLPAGNTFSISEFGMNLEKFLEHAASLARGETYLHTESKSAPYRDKFRDKPTD